MQSDNWRTIEMLPSEYALLAHTLKPLIKKYGKKVIKEHLELILDKDARLSCDKKASE